MKLITESTENVEVIVENNNGKKSLFIEGVFMQGEVKNRNKRVYPMQTLRNAVKIYKENFIDKGRSVGELNHGPTPSIDLSKVSHKIESLREAGNDYYGKARILQSLPMGKIAAGLHEEGVKLGVSSRAVGSLTQTNEGHSIVGPDLMLSTIDIVADPSGPNCFVEGLYEGVDWIFNTKKQIWIAENIKHKVEQDVISKVLTEERKLQHFENFLNLI
jgi:hypothetical protein